MFRYIISRSFSSNSPTIKEIFRFRQLNQPLKVKGWIKTIRSMKELFFSDINDGTTGENLQLVCSKSDKSKLIFGSSIEATGMLTQTPKGQLEVKVDNIKVIGDCPAENYPYVARTSYTPE